MKDKWPGSACRLRDTFREIRKRQKDWSVVAAIQVEEFVRRPSRQTFTDCQKAAGKIKAWPKVRASLLKYLENGEPPWKQKAWVFPHSGLDVPALERKGHYPMVDRLIEIAILEKKPEHVLHWYDQLPQKRYGWYGADDDAVATAVQTHAPDRAVAIWQNKVERLIAQVKPKAYQEAGKYLRKAAKIMAAEKDKRSGNTICKA